MTKIIDDRKEEIFSIQDLYFRNGLNLVSIPGKGTVYLITHDLDENFYLTDIHGDGLACRLDDMGMTLESQVMLVDAELRLI